MKKSVYVLSLLLVGVANTMCASSSSKASWQKQSVQAAEQQDRPEQPSAVTAESILKSWQPGEVLTVSPTDTAAVLECFTISEIPDSVFSRMKGKSYKDNCRVPLEELRYLTIPHYDGHDAIRMGEMVCNKSIAQDLIEIFKAAYEVGYPIELIVLVDNFDADDRASMSANNTSCFNYRVVAGSAKLSNHALGRAIDVNPLYNPYVKRSAKGLYVSPPNGRPYADRTKEFKYKTGPGDFLYEQFVKHGFFWGGAWRSMQDYQHFEKKQ